MKTKMNDRLMKKFQQNNAELFQQYQDEIETESTRLTEAVRNLKELGFDYEDIIPKLREVFGVASSKAANDSGVAVALVSIPEVHEFLLSQRDAKGGFEPVSSSVLENKFGRGVRRVFTTMSDRSFAVRLVFRGKVYYRAVEGGAQ